MTSDSAFVRLAEAKEACKKELLDDLRVCFEHEQVFAVEFEFYDEMFDSPRGGIERGRMPNCDVTGPLSDIDKHAYEGVEEQVVEAMRDMLYQLGMDEDEILAAIKEVAP